MANARASLLVALVVVFGIGAFIAMYSTSRKGFDDSENTYSVHASFEDVSGLGPRTRVTIAGVQVGEVREITLDPESADRALVTLVLNKEVVLFAGVPNSNGGVDNGATITRRQASLLGDQYLELNRGLFGDQLQHGDRIPNTVSRSGLDAVMRQMERTGSLVDRIERIFGELEAIAQDVKKVSGAVSNTFGGPKGQKQLTNIATNIETASSDVKTVLADVKGFTKDVRKFMGASVLGRGDQVGRIVGNVEKFTANAASLSLSATKSVKDILDDVKAVTGDVRRLIKGSKGDVETSLGTIKGTLAQVTLSLQRLNSTLDNLKSITGKIDKGKGSIGKLVNDDKLVNNIEEVVTDAGDIVKRVSTMQTRVELSSEYYFEQQALKHYLRLRLQPREDKYYLLELVDDPRGKTTTTSTVTQTNDPGAPPVVHETSSSTTEELKFSFQFAKRWYFLTGRFGVIESTGGLGVDVELFGDSLKFGADLFDFSSDEAPRMRLLANYEFYKHFYVSAGVDDVFNSAGFDWFLGGGIRFTDDDLKALLTVAPTPSL